MGVSFSSAEMLSVYSTAQTDWADLHKWNPIVRYTLQLYFYQPYWVVLILYWGFSQSILSPIDRVIKPMEVGMYSESKFYWKIKSLLSVFI